jgi:hypothetical protein
MTDQETGGAPAPVTDAPASQAEQTTDVTTAKPGSEADSSPAAKDQGEQRAEPDGRDEKIKELTRRWREEQRRSDRLMRHNEELTRRSNPLAQQPAAQQPAAQQPQPSLNPNDIGELAAQKARELLQQQAETERRAEFDSRVDKFASEVEDYDEVVTDRTPVSEHMAAAVMDSDIPGDLLYYLGKNPDVARKLYQLPLTKAAKEIGRIEDRLIAERKKAAEKPVSKAPPPPPRIEGAGDGSTKAKPDDPASDADLSDAEWTRRRNAQIAARQRARS